MTSSGNPITMDMKTRYKVKGIGSEQTIESVIQIFTNGEGRITEVQDRWNGKLPEGAIAKVSLFDLLNPFWWVGFWGALIWWRWSFVWWTRGWLVCFAVSREVVGGGNIGILLTWGDVGF